MKPKSTINARKVQEQVEALHEEMSTLSKRKPDDAVNKFKLKFINQVITEANQVLNDGYLPFADFSTFDEDNLPTNSDVVLILAQYLKCFHRKGIDKPSIQW